MKSKSAKHAILFTEKRFTKKKVEKNPILAILRNFFEKMEKNAIYRLWNAILHKK